MKTHKRTDSERLALDTLVNYLNNADPVFGELRADVQRLLHPPPIPAKARSDMSVREYWLRAVGKKILAMNVTHGRRVQRLGDWPYLWKPHRLRLGDEVFIYTTSPAKALLSVSRGERKRRMTYWLLDQTLLPGGGFSQVRRCRQCSKFFTSYRRKAEACSPACNSDYHNTKYQREGKFMRSYYQRKKKKLIEARRLWKEKTPLDQIMDETGLTRLALIRAGCGSTKHARTLPTPRS